MDQDSSSEYKPEYKPSTHMPPEDNNNTEFTPPSHAEPPEHHNFHPHVSSMVSEPNPPAPGVPSHSMPITHDLVSPTPIPPAPTAVAGVTPQPVVKVLSPRGVEYVFMTIALLTAAIGLVYALLALVNGQTKFAVLYFPLSLLLVAVPVFSWLFLRLKQAELVDPAARLDASKRRSTQFIQIITFLVCFFTLISFLSIIFAKVSGSYTGSIFKVILDVLVILLVTGGILFYYWNDEHKAN